jgi:hypothetical protein
VKQFVLLLQEQVGTVGYAVKKFFFAETNKHHCMNTDNNVVEMMQRLKHWLS